MSEPARSAPNFRRRRRLAVLLGLALLVGLGVGVRVLLYDAGLADVTDVQVTGTSTVAVADVLAAAEVTPGSPLVAVDTAGIAGRVRRLPAVATVDVRRSWPHTVVVAVTERTPVATVDAAAGPLLVDATGVAYPGPVPPGLPRLAVAAPRPEDPTTRAALAVLTALPPQLRSQVLTVEVTGTDPGQVALRLTDDRQVLWGSPERVPDKVAVLGPLLTERGHVFDVTSPDLPTIRR